MLNCLTGPPKPCQAFESLVRGWEFSSELTSDVITPLQGSGWRGPAAEQAAGAITKVRNEIDAAFEEAGAIARALRDAHAELFGAQVDLMMAIHSAVGRGMAVDDDTGAAEPNRTGIRSSTNILRSGTYDSACRTR
ncbi:hypothetical protein ACIF6L_08910 [Kitasatospora sp. NPDC086009]|uniref:hypothetical protein n=1 Tax=unclassified Kitasatospora TaxID=2633591 RepID=UPI0037C7E88D